MKIPGLNPVYGLNSIPTNESGCETACLYGALQSLGLTMLRAFGHRVAMCCSMLGVVGSSLKMVKCEPTTSKTSQRVATRWPNAPSVLRPTVSLVCWYVAECLGLLAWLQCFY